MLTTRIEKRILMAALFVATLLRLVNLGAGDPISDEATNAFRALGPIDFDAAAAQSTPWQWLDPGIPWWAYLSFHDHPLLTFYIENISMKIFGETDFAYRFPAAIFGISSVYLLYLLSRRFFGAQVALISSALLAVTVNHIYVSRIGLQESYVIFFILLIFILFFKALENDGKFLWLGFAVGLGLSAKYTVFIAVIICLIYISIFRRDIFRNKRLYWAVGIAILIFSPSIIYNLMLYKIFGHFDFQISHILGDYPEEWMIAPGKDIGTLTERLRSLPVNIFKTNSWVFLALAFGGIVSSLSLRGIRQPADDAAISRRPLIFLIIATVMMLLLLLKIGTAYRFLTMLTPFTVMWVGLGVNAVYRYLPPLPRLWRAGAMMVFGLFFVFELFYSLNSQILSYPVGKMPWAFSNVRYENYNWGYNELGEFLNKEFGDRVPALSFDAKYIFLNELKDKDIERGVRAGLPKSPTLILYEGNFDFAAKLWYLDRLQVYHGWPLMSFREYLKILGEQGSDYFNKLGFREYYLIFATNIVPDKIFNDFVRGKNVMPILNKKGEEAFRIFNF